MRYFLSKDETKLSKKYKEQGYIIFKNFDKSFLKEVERTIKPFLIEKLKLKKNIKFLNILNNFHKYIEIKDLNKLRLDLIKLINSSKKIRELYFINSRPYLYSLIGNELAMQNRINLSIQLPNDDSSLLPIHSDTWSGDSPYETVVWVPLVNCYKTKSMYILKAKNYKNFLEIFKKFKNQNSQFIFKKIKKNLLWIKVKSGESLIFNQNLPHGNVVNLEKETRWSFNCRFKGLFSPYGDKKIGEFFTPITPRAQSEIGMNYDLPKL